MSRPKTNYFIFAMFSVDILFHVQDEFLEVLAYLLATACCVPGILSMNFIWLLSYVKKVKRKKL